MNKFVIVTPAYNCESKIETTLYSIIGQTYKNWVMYLIDDMSTDNTSSVIESFISNHQLEEKIILVKRNEKFGETRNTCDIVQRLNPDDIVVRVDSGDFITDLGCFEYLNEIYSEHDPAVLWTKHRWAFTDENISGPLNVNYSVYHQPWVSSHMKTFRVKDFLPINEKNFKDKTGNWIMIACDQAIFLPILERARLTQRPLIYWNSLMYHYDINLQDPELFTKDRSLEQKTSAEMIRSRGFIE